MNKNFMTNTNQSHTNLKATFTCTIGPLDIFSYFHLFLNNFVDCFKHVL